MGSGAPRELSTGVAEVPELDAELAERLGRALATMDAQDEEFKQGRIDEKYQQLSKAWGTRCSELVEEFRTLGYSMVASHQILCDCGQDGAGTTIRPWLEEAMQRWPRLELHLNADGSVSAKYKDHVLGTKPDMWAIDYAWLESIAVDWVEYVVQHGA